MKKRIIPKAWFWQTVSSDDKEKPQSLLELCIRFGTLMSSDFVGEMKDDIYILPCLCFHFNHSEFYIRFAWLNFEVWMLYKNWKLEDKYIRRLMEKKNETEIG